MSKLSKNLYKLEEMADELLKKSVKKSEDKEDLKPEDVSENAPDEDEVKESPETQEEDEEKEEEEEEAPEKEEEIEKSEEFDEEEEVEKSEDEEDEDLEKSEDGEEEEEVEDEDEVREGLEKSFQGEFYRNPEIQKSLDASDFLTAVTEVFSKSMADVCYDIRKSNTELSSSSEVLAKSLQASLQLNKSMAQEISLLKSQNKTLKKSIEKSFSEFREFMEERFDSFSHEPVSVRKSLNSVSVADRNFSKSLNIGAGETLSKSEALTKMSNLLLSGNSIITPQDIISYESGAPLRPEVLQLIKS